LGYLRVGKIEQSMEGCACPMGAVARSFLKQLEVSEGQWVIVDTEAGVEHFGRGVLEGADVVIAVVDPSHEAVLLAEKAGQMASQAKKPFVAVLNKVDDQTEAYLKKELAARGIPVAGAVTRSPEIERANLIGGRVEAGAWSGSLGELTDSLVGLVENK
jgi:CO dehydrogenase maturation factor